MAENVGSIFYEVEVETAKAVESSTLFDRILGKTQDSLKRTDDSADKLNTRMNKTAKAVKEATREMESQRSSVSGLTKVLGAYLSLRTLQAVIALSDQYGQMASRIRNATDSAAEYEKVQNRLLETANGTYRSLSEAQEVYLSTADVLRGLGYSTEQVLDITDSLSYAFVRDAARADQATSAMDAYSKALQKGKIDADAWATILAATPSIVEGISEATGRTEKEVRKLGATGKLSTDALNEGLRQSREENKRLADEMEVSVKDAFVKLRNAMQLFIGKLNESSGASKILTENVSEMADILKDPETIKAAQELAGGVVGALNLIIKGAKEVVGIVKWMAEELAANIHGAAADDIVRLQDQLADLQQQRREINPVKDLFTGDSKIIDEQIEKTKSLIDLYNKSAAVAPKAAPAEESKSTGGNRKVNAENVDTEKEAIARLKRQQQLMKQQAENQKVINELARELMLNEKDLFAAKASDRLNEFASPEQIAQVEELAKALFDLNAIEERRKKFGDDPTKTITGDVKPLEGGQFDDQFARYAAEAAAEEKRYADQLARLQEAKQLQIEVTGGYLALEEQMLTEHNSRIAQIENAKQSLFLKNAEDGFGAVSDVLKQAVGEQSGIYKAAFAASKAFAIAQSIISIQQGIAQAAANPWPVNLGAMASVAAATAGLVSNISSVTLGSGRQYGGPVSPNAMHRVNENGDPEILNMANGQQYLLPGSRGNVSPMDGAGTGKTSSESKGDTKISIAISINAADGSVNAKVNPSQYEQFAKDVGTLVDARFQQLQMESNLQGGSMWNARNGRG